MTIIQLEYLLAVANCGSFSQAAEHCFVTQPSLSMQVKALEEELGVVLLDRSKKPVIPTEAGEVVIGKARETLKAYNCIREAVSELKGETAGKLRLGVIPTIAPYLLHKFIPAFVRDYPKVELEISEMITSDIVEALKRDRIDAALVASGTCGEGITEQELFSDRFYAYVSPENPLFERSNIRIEDIDLKDSGDSESRKLYARPDHRAVPGPPFDAFALHLRVGVARYAHAHRGLHFVSDDRSGDGRGVHPRRSPRPAEDHRQGGHFAQDRRRRAAHLCQEFDHQGPDGHDSGERPGGPGLTAAPSVRSVSLPDGCGLSARPPCRPTARPCVARHGRFFLRLLLFCNP